MSRTAPWSEHALARSGVLMAAVAAAAGVAAAIGWSGEVAVCGALVAFVLGVCQQALP